MTNSSALTVRAATIEDHGHYAAMVPELGVDDPILAPERWSTELMPGTLLFEENTDVVGYAWIAPMGKLGYVRHVVVAKHARGRGVGRFMMEEIATRLRAGGCTSWALNVKRDNTPAVRLYSSMGFSKAFDSTSMRLGWDCVEKLEATSDEVSVQLVDPDEDAAIENVFHLPEKRLTELRSRKGWILFRLVRPDKPSDVSLGLACFQPNFPGCFPFRVAKPSLARPLLDALRPHGLPSFDYVNIFVENDDALQDAFVQAGGRVLFEVMHMQGDIPQ